MDTDCETVISLMMLFHNGLKTKINKFLEIFSLSAEGRSVLNSCGISLKNMKTYLFYFSYCNAR